MFVHPKFAAEPAWWVDTLMRTQWTTETFIARAREVHGGKYEYPETVYVTGKRKVTIHCPKHGAFLAQPLQHLKGVQCLKCANEDMTASLDTFLTKARAVHGDRYDYSQVDYRGNRKPVTILCNEHGSFTQLPSNHVRGRRCPGCVRAETSERQTWSTAEFIERAKAKHGDRYCYDQVEYRGKRDKVTVVCREHGPFSVWPQHHLKGQRCRQCFDQTRRIPFKQLVEQIEAIHGARYAINFNADSYENSQTPVSMICEKHKEFLIRPGVILRGGGCRKCADEEMASQRSMTKEVFVEKARAVHGEKYGYGEAQYRNTGTKLFIRCEKHGLFEQTPESHIYNGAGCPSCVHQYSTQHKEIESHLESLGVAFESNVRSVIPPKEVDIWIPEHRLAIEFNGAYWHSLTANTHSTTAKQRHLHKFQACMEVGVSLLQIDEHEWENPITREIWKSVLASKLGKHTRVAARKTQFTEISQQEANQFLFMNHLQQDCPAIRWAFGLKLAGTLFGVITFTGHEKEEINLSRLAFARGTTVVGGAQKLFRNSIPRLPVRPIITFSHNQYSGGDIYRTLGFTWDGSLPPSYQWLFENRVLNKRQCRHKHLPKLIGDTYNPQETEHQNMYRAGARCLYDAGYQRWVYLNK